MSRTTLQRGRMRHHRDALCALAERYSKFAAFPMVLGRARGGQGSGLKRQAVLALSAAFCGAAVLAVVGAKASEPRDPALTKAFGQAIDPPPLLLRPLAKSTAIALNESIAFSQDFHQAAPFKFTGDPMARARAVECLTTAIYYEAASESAQGQQAVAQVVLNRVRSPSFPSSICSVVYQGSLLKTGCQFSFTCDGSLHRAMLRPEWLHARQIAEAALDGWVMPQVGLSTHYHTIDVVPYWATSLAKQVQVGRHIFYRWPGSYGRPGAFRQKYAGNEGDPFLLRDTALVAKGIWPSPMEGMTAPEIEVSSDARLEAAAIVELLGRAPASEPSAFEAAARAHFEPPATVSADKLAFDSETGNSAEAPTAPAAMTVGEDLASSSRMREFLRAHRRDYKAAATQAGEALQRLAAGWQTYTGSAIAPQRVKLLLSNSLIEPRCKAAPMAGLSLHAIAIQPWDYRLFIASGLPNGLVAAKSKESRALAKRVETVRTDLVFAVFARIAALSGGPKEQALALRFAATEGRPLVLVFVKRLETFERNRMQYPSLSDFLPELLKDLPAEQPSDAAAADDATCGWAAPVLIASADDRPPAIVASRDPRP